MYMCYLASPAAFDALDAAAVNGHLDVGRYIVPHVKDKKYVHGTKAAGILAHAISARHMDVVEYLFGQDSSWWDLAEAFIAAVAVEQHTLADRIFEAYRREDKEAFLVEVAGHEGNLQAVKYLYYNGQNNSELISDAFVSAANYSHIATMEFLYDTKRVSRGAFDEAMMDVATWRRP
ncbi:hypothetical protein JG687_00006317 [Phytophthora cactorum]|uniref:Ankyrin repeat-containing domain n=1 Tax=Phytophthora cactorum TaxID=29920 RepID=A0A8T1UN80_9STRA|nr:hypothetical protein JG687_00006317 [Phytophthora cactorum]